MPSRMQADVGKVIGKGGAAIKGLRQRSGAAVTIHVPKTNKPVALRDRSCP